MRQRPAWGGGARTSSDLRRGTARGTLSSWARISSHPSSTAFALFIAPRTNERTHHSRVAEGSIELAPRRRHVAPPAAAVALARRHV